MATSQRVDSFSATEDLDADLSRIERHFQPGEYGEIVFRLDRNQANEAGQDNVQKSTRELSSELAQQGMVSWPGQSLATLDWNAKKVSIRFIDQATPSAHLSTPSYFIFAVQAARAAAVVGVRAGFWAFLLRGVTRTGAIFRKIGGGITRGSAVNAIAAGLLIWSLIDIGSLVEVFKWTGKGVGKAAKELLGTPLLLGFGVLAVGLVLMSRGK